MGLHVLVVPSRSPQHRFAAMVVGIALWAGCGASAPDGSDAATGQGTAGSDAGTGQGTGGADAGGARGVDSAGAGGGVGIDGQGAGTAGADASGPIGNRDAAAAGTIDCRREGDGKTTLVFVNHCVADVRFRGSDIQGGSLAPGAFACVDLGSATEALSSKRYWGFVGDDPGAEHHSLAEFTFNTDFNDFDWYNISYVDAFNLPLQIAPVGRPACKTLTCAADLLSGCPEAGAYRNAKGAIVACVSPERDNPNSPVARHFESCDDAYAWSGDDQQGTDPSPMRACAGEDWDITFCPEAP